MGEGSFVSLALPSYATAGRLDQNQGSNPAVFGFAINSLRRAPRHIPFRTVDFDDSRQAEVCLVSVEPYASKISTSADSVHVLRKIRMFSASISLRRSAGDPIQDGSIER